MNATELALLVKRMRDAQRRYFKGRTSDLLCESKRLEAEVDGAVAATLSGPSLFDDAPPVPTAADEADGQ